MITNKVTKTSQKNFMTGSHDIGPGLPWSRVAVSQPMAVLR